MKITEYQNSEYEQKKIFKWRRVRQWLTVSGRREKVTNMTSFSSIVIEISYYSDIVSQHARIWYLQFHDIGNITFQGDKSHLEKNKNTYATVNEG